MRVAGLKKHSHFSLGALDRHLNDLSEESIFDLIESVAFNFVMDELLSIVS